MEVNSSIFRAYDIRGLYPEEINADVARHVAYALARYLGFKTVVIGKDGRTSSPELIHAVCEGLVAAGVKVYNIGQCSTPAFYYATKKLKSGNGIMITASHNPAKYNGIKIVSDGLSFAIGEEKAEILVLMEKGITAAPIPGKVVDKLYIQEEYLHFLTKQTKLRKGLVKTKCVVDAGNGTGALTMGFLLDRLDVGYTPLHFEVEGTFGGRSPDPSTPGALDTLSKSVVVEKAAVGFAFDGDADRLVVVDETGHIVSPQYILALLWQYTSKLFRKPRVVYDLRFSRAVRALFGKYGTRSQVGHTYVSAMMRWVKADIGGELSGHFFFRVMNYMESSELAALKILEILEKTKQPLSMLVKPYQKYFYSGEITLPRDSNQRAEHIFAGLLGIYSDGKWDKFDGLTIEYPTWWFNLRPSQTEPVMRLVVEADTKELMEEKVGEIKKFISP